MRRCDFADPKNKARWELEQERVKNGGKKIKSIVKTMLKVITKIIEIPTYLIITKEKIE